MLGNLCGAAVSISRHLPRPRMFWARTSGRRGHRLWLVIAGDGKEKDKLKQLAEAQLPQRTRFVGRVVRSDLYRYYSAADVFVFPGIRESLGLVFLEAQACGLPVVAFDNAGVPEAVNGGVTGLLTPAFDAGAFEKAIALDPEKEDYQKSLKKLM